MVWNSLLRPWQGPVPPVLMRRRPLHLGVPGRVRAMGLRPLLALVNSRLT